MNKCKIVLVWKTVPDPFWIGWLTKSDQSVHVITKSDQFQISHNLIGLWKQTFLIFSLRASRHHGTTEPCDWHKFGPSLGPAGPNVEVDFLSSELRSSRDLSTWTRPFCQIVADHWTMAGSCLTKHNKHSWNSNEFCLRDSNSRIGHMHRCGPNGPKRNVRPKTRSYLACKHE